MLVYGSHSVQRLRPLSSTPVDKGCPCHAKHDHLGACAYLIQLCVCAAGGRAMQNGGALQCTATCGIVHLEVQACKCRWPERLARVP